ncbi:MAG: CPBP family intramembrane metalloprotease [candidate division KSB1 bacterium]|nr:CPBP family intramembrane metalloprotease [candidate division KSB1 bacterium]
MSRHGRRRGSYWRASRTPFYGIVMTLPLLLLYEGLLIYLTFRQGEAFRNAADIWIKTAIERLGIHGQITFSILLLLLLIWAFVSMVRQNLDLNWQILLPAAAESCFYALALAFLVSRFTNWALLHLMIGGERATDLVLALGAGVYEELFFRAFGYGILSAVILRVIGRKPKRSRRPVVPLKRLEFEVRLFIALITSLLFSWLHNPSGFSLTAYQPLYRFVMGLFFCILYEFRGLGITVWTHSWYDVFVILFGNSN